MSDTTFFRGENPLRADKLNLAFSEKVQRTGDTMMGVLTLYGDPTNAMDAATKQYVDTNFSTSLAGSFLQIIGGTMQGFIALHAPPVQPLHAASKGYVDALVAASTGSGTYLPLAGGTLTGPLTLSSDPSNPLHSATKQYVDTKIAAIPPSSGGGASVSVSDTPPATPAQGDMWFDSTNAQLFLRYEDANSNQWVVANTGGSAVAVIADTPPSLSSGGLWWDSKGGQLYVRYDDGNSSAYVAATNVPGQANVATKDDVASTQNNSGRNVLHNAFWNVAQRGGGPFTASGYTMDRWRAAVTLDTVNFARGTIGDAGRTQIGDESALYYLQNQFVGNAGATALNVLQQPIERVHRLAGKTVIFSFWAQAQTAIKLGASLDQWFGSGGSPSAGLAHAGQATAALPAGIWTRCSFVFVVPSVIGKTVGTNNDDSTSINIWFSSGANTAVRSGGIGVQSGTVSLWGPQLEIAAAGQTQPSPLDKPDPREDLANCQRFYQIGYAAWYGYGFGGNNIGSGVAFPTSMRAAPTLAFSATGYSNASGVNAGAVAYHSCQIVAVATATGLAAFTTNYTASADL